MTEGAVEADLHALGWALTSPFDEARARRAARAVLAASEPSAVLGRLFPLLMNQKGLEHALTHLERAGADLAALSVPTALVAGTFPLSRQPLWPVPAEPQWPLGHLAATLDRRRALLWQVNLDLASCIGAERFVLLSGRAMEALFPAYQGRMGFDSDLWFPGRAEGVEAVEVLVRELGFELKFANIYETEARPRLAASLHRAEEGYDVVVGVLAGGYHFYTESVDEHAVGVVWDGHALRAAAPEDLLAMVAVRILKRRGVQMVNVADAAVLLRKRPFLDPARVRLLSRRYGLDLTLGLLLGHVEAAWPGTVPMALRDLTERAPRLHRALTSRALLGAEDHPMLPLERLAFALTKARRDHPRWGWGRATGALLASRMRLGAARALNAVRTPLRLPARPMPGSRSRPLCGAASPAVAQAVPTCAGNRPDARWVDRASPEVRDAADRLVVLTSRERHDCRWLRAWY